MGFVRWRCFCLSRCHLSIGRRSTGLAATYDPTDPLAGCSSKRRLSLHPPPQVHSLTHSLNHPPTCTSLTHSVIHQPTTCSTIPNWTISAIQPMFKKYWKKTIFGLKTIWSFIWLCTCHTFSESIMTKEDDANEALIYQIYSEPPGTSSSLCAQNGPWPNTASHALFFLFLFCQNHHLLTLFNHSSPFKYWACSESIIVFWVIPDSTAHTQDSGLSCVSQLWLRKR